MKQYQETFTLRAADVDLYGRWRPGAIFTAMQEIAITHADKLGCGRDPMLERGMFWAIFRTQLKMEAYPLMGDEIIMTTWPGKSNRGFFPRYHTFAGPDGTIYGAASSIWLIVDKDARSMIMQPELPVPMPDTSAFIPPLPYPERTASLDGEERIIDFIPVYTDLDVNQHVNNARYVDWVTNALPFALVKTYSMNNIVINYLKEIRPEQPMRLSVVTKENAFAMVAEDAESGQPCFESSGLLVPWTAKRTFL